MVGQFIDLLVTWFIDYYDYDYDYNNFKKNDHDYNLYRNYNFMKKNGVACDSIFPHLGVALGASCPMGCRTSNFSLNLK